MCVAAFGFLMFFGLGIIYIYIYIQYFDFEEWNWKELGRCFAAFESIPQNFDAKSVGMLDQYATEIQTTRQFPHSAAIVEQSDTSWKELGMWFSRKSVNIWDTKLT